MGDAAQPRRQTSGAATAVVRTTHAQSGGAAKHVSARKCLPDCIEKPSAVRGDRVRTVALSSMVLPCTASALAMYLRPASRRPAYQSAYAIDVPLDTSETWYMPVGDPEADMLDGFDDADDGLKVIGFDARRSRTWCGDLVESISLRWCRQLDLLINGFLFRRAGSRRA